MKLLDNSISVRGNNMELGIKEGKCMFAKEKKNDFAWLLSISEVWGQNEERLCKLG